MAGLGNKVVIITGAAGGIGRGLCDVFGREGVKIVANDVDSEALAGLEEHLKRSEYPVLRQLGDVSNTVDVEELVKNTISHFGRVDILINNAGLKTNRPGSNVPVADMSDELWDRTLAVNLRGPFLLSRAVGRHLIRQAEGGKIINISSSGWRTARAGAAHYCSSKAGLVQLTRVLAMELAPFKVTVNAISPGLIDIEPRPLSPARQKFIEARLKQIPLGRAGTAEEVGYIAAFLASDKADFITGSVIELDGGSHAGIMVPPSG